ncbi:MAG: hypothetical protein NVSMB25_04490 [Thermoleophilaceae bacterium]
MPFGRIGQRRGIAVGAATLVAGRVVSGLSTLIATPILFARLGSTAFGLWTVLLGAAAITGYADAGLGSMLLRETSGAHTGAAALRRARGALGLAFVVPTVVGATLTAALLASWPALAPALRLGALSNPARIAALLLIAGVVIEGWGAAGRATLEGTGRIPRAASVTAASGALAALLGVLAVLGGFGLVGLAASVTIGMAGRSAALALLARRSAPHLVPRLSELRRGDMAPLLRYGGAIQISKACGAVNAESDRLVISGVSGVVAAGGLELGLRLVNLLGLVPFCVLYALFPALARLVADGDRRGLHDLYVRASRQVAAIALLPAALLCACAPSVVVLWIGRPVAFASDSVLVLAPGMAIWLLTGVASAVWRAEGKAGKETRIVLITVSLNILLTVVLAVILGPIGVPLATSAALILGAAAFTRSFHRSSERSLAQLAAALCAPACAAAAAAGAALAAGTLVADGADRQHAALAIGVRGVAGVLAASVVFGALTIVGRIRSARAPMATTGEPTWVLYLSAIPWDGRRNRQQELAGQVARSRRVLFVEAPGLGVAWRLRVDLLGESLWRVRPLALVPFGRFIPAANAINRRYSGWRLRSWLDRRPGARTVILDEDLAAPLAARLDAAALIYDAADLDWTFTRRWNRWHLRTALASAVSQADLVLTSSSALADHLPASHAPVVELTNACDVEHFSRDARVPAWVESLPRPRIGYVGALDERAFDEPLVTAVARANPGWTFALVGTASDRVAARLAPLANVHLLGPVSYEDLPGVLGGFDVCLIPYRVGGRIDYVQPKKLFEYLAAGKPVVTTALPALSRLEIPCHCGGTPEAFARGIAAALGESAPAAVEARRSCARAHTWDARGHTLRMLLDQMESAA